MDRFPGSLLYCIRRHKTVVSRQSNGTALAVNLKTPKGESAIPERFYEPYGLTYDAREKCVWLIDKLGFSLWKCSIERKSNTLSLVVQEKHEVPGRCPCMVDYDAERGLLIALYGFNGGRAGICTFKQGHWTKLVESAVAVTHCAWLPKGAYCYVTRNDSVLWYSDSTKVPPRRLSKPQSTATPAESGLNENVHFRYVQGLIYSERYGALLVADANFGAIFAVDLVNGKYRLLAGAPKVSYSDQKSAVQPGEKTQWLGAIRGLYDTPNGLLWIDGHSAKLMMLAKNDEIEDLGSLLPKGVVTELLGTGVTVIP